MITTCIILVPGSQVKDQGSLTLGARGKRNTTMQPKKPQTKNPTLNRQTGTRKGKQSLQKVRNNT